MEQLVEALVRPEVTDEPENDVARVQAVGPPGIGVRHVVRVDAEIGRVGEVEDLVGRDLVQGRGGCDRALGEDVDHVGASHDAASQLHVHTRERRVVG